MKIIQILKMNSYIQNKSELQLMTVTVFHFLPTKNKQKHLTEYYNFMYQYKNDCLAASIEYNKQFYSDRDLNSGESVFFKISFIPFGTISSPKLND